MSKRAKRVASHATIITIILFAEPSASTAKNSKPAASPPSMTKLPDVPVFAALPDGRMIGVSMGSTTSGQAMMARYSSDGGRTWSESKETLCPLPKELGSWGLHNVLVDHDGELHLFLTTDGNIVAKGLYDTHFDIYHVGSENGRTKWKAARFGAQRLLRFDAIGDRTEERANHLAGMLSDSARLEQPRQGIRCLHRHGSFQLGRASTRTMVATLGSNLTLS